MSQAKVDQNKKLKQNRKKIVKREKMISRLWATGGVVLAAALVVWICFSVNSRVQEYRAANPTTTEVDLTELMMFDFE